MRGVQKKFFKRKQLKYDSKKLYYICLISFAAILNIALIFNNNVWCDEAFILNACKMSYKDLIDYLIHNDMRPPLYLISAKTFTLLFGNTVPVLKIFSIIPAILTMCLGATVIDKNWGYGSRKTGTIFILLTALSPSGLTKNIEITIYSWTMFWVTCSAVFAYEIYVHYEKKVNWCIFIISSVCSAATHYYALITEAIIYVILGISLMIRNKRELIGWGKICVVTSVLYIPVLPFFLWQFKSARASFWIQSVNIHILLQSIRMPFEGENVFVFSHDFTTIIWIGIAGSVIYYINNVRKVNGRQQINYLYSCILILILALFLMSGYLISKLIRPLFIDRYFYVVTGILWLYIAIMAESFIANRKVNAILIGLILVMALYAYPEVKNREYSNATRESIQYLKPMLSEDDIFINNAEECASWELEYYFPGHKYYLDCDEGIYYKDKKFDFSTLDTTAWYMCKSTVELDVSDIEDYGLEVKWMNELNFDNYYFFDLYKIYPKEGK